MALSGVRSSWLILARNFDLVWLASSARVFSSRIFFGEVGELERLPFQRGLRAFQVDHGGAQAQVVVDQLLLVLLDAGDVGADRDVAAVLGAALADMQPAAVVELRLEGARARRLARRSRAAGCGPPACCRPRSRSHRRCRGSRRSPAACAGAGNASCRAPGGRSASHSTKASGMVSIASRSRRSASTVFSARLFCSVMSTAMPIRCRPASAGAVAELAAHPQPDPVAVGVLHAEGLVDVVDLAGDQLVGDREQVDVVGFHQRVDFAEGQEVAAGVEARAW